MTSGPDGSGVEHFGEANPPHEISGQIWAGDVVNSGSPSMQGYPAHEEQNGAGGSERGRTTRFVAGVVGGVVVAGMFSLAAYKVTESVVPHEEIVTEQVVNAELTKVQEDTSQDVLSGKGQGSADVSVALKGSVLFLHYTVPRWFVGKGAHVTLPRTEVVSLAPGAVILEGIRKARKWETVALVNPRLVRANVQGDQPPTNAGASSGFLNRVLETFNIDPNADQKTFTDAEYDAAQIFSSSAAETMTDTSMTPDGKQVFGAAIANEVRAIDREVEGPLTGVGRKALSELANGTIEVEYVNNDDGHLSFVPPVEAQSMMPLPKAPTPGTNNVPVGHGLSVVFGLSTPDRVASPSKVTLTDGVSKSLEDIAGQTGYVIARSPIDIPKTPVHTRQ